MELENLRKNFVAACTRGDLEVFRGLIDTHAMSLADLFDRPWLGPCAMFSIACFHGHLSLVEYMINLPDFKFIPRDFMHSPMRRACCGVPIVDGQPRHGVIVVHEPVIRFILGHPKYTFNLSDCVDILSASIDNDKVDLLELVIDDPRTPQVMEGWAWGRGLMIVPDLLKKPHLLKLVMATPVLSIMMGPTRSLTHLACESDSIESIKLLVDAGLFDFSARKHAGRDETPLLTACRKFDYKVNHNDPEDGFGAGPLAFEDFYGPYVQEIFARMEIIKFLVSHPKAEENYVGEGGLAAYEHLAASRIVEAQAIFLLWGMGETVANYAQKSWSSLFPARRDEIAEAIQTGEDLASKRRTLVSLLGFEHIYAADVFSLMIFHCDGLMELKQTD